MEDLRRYLNEHQSVNVRYYKNEFNIGIDRNHEKVFEYAESLFTLLIADDDIALYSQIDKLVEKLTKIDPGIMLWGICSYIYHNNGSVVRAKALPIRNSYYSYSDIFQLLVNAGKYGLCPLLPVYSGIIINTGAVNAVISKSERQLFYGTDHLYIGVLWNALIKSEKKVLGYSDSIVAIRTGGKSSWDDNLEKVIYKDIPKFYKNLYVTDDLKKWLIRKHLERFKK